MRTRTPETQAILNYVPTTSMKWGELWSDQIAEGRFYDALTEDMPSTEWKTALWCNSYMEAVAVKRALQVYGGLDAIICCDEVERFVVLTMEQDVR